MTDTTTRTPQPGDILPFTATEATLANGLKVIVVPTGFPNLVSLQIPVQTGSRNEVEEGKSGFAHFFEHMMFRGTKRFPADEYQAVITRTGARQNAYTTDDYTNYHITFAKEDLETILDLEADRFMNLEYSEAAFKTESRAVLGEYNKSNAEPLNKLIEVQRDTAFAAHPYKHTTMGFLRDIEDMPNQFEYSRTFFERWYRPEYTTVIVAGDVDPAATIALVERLWGAWSLPEKTAPLDIPQEPPAEGPETAHVPWPTETLPWVTVAFHGPAFSDIEKDHAALDTALDLLFGETSDLYQRLVEREQKVDQLFPYMPSNQDPELATIMARVKSADDAVYVRDLILTTVAEARTKPVDARRLADAKSHNRYAFARAFDNSESIAGTLARFVRYDRDYGTLNRLFRVYDALAPEDLQAASRKYLTDGNMVVTTLAHGELATATTAAPRLADLEGSTSTTAEGAAPRFLVQESESSLLRLKLLFTAGSAHDPAGKEGLARLAASMITEAGSQRQRIDEINRALFPLAAGMGAQVDREMTTFTGVAHTDTLERFIDIVMPQLLDPGFREDDFARLKEHQRNALVQDLRANNEEELGKERLQQLVFEGTPYGHPTLGSVSGIETITLDDVKAFIAEHYTTANLTVGLSGAFPAGFEERMSGMLGTLGGFPSGDRSTPSGHGGPRLLDGMRVEIIEKETRSTAISLGHPTEVTRTHPDFPALWLARAYLGEHRASVGRLYNRIRELRGMNYGDYAYVEAFPRGMYQFQPDPNLARRAQIFEVWIRPVPPEQAVFALKLALFELQKLIDEGISEDDFEATLEYLSKNVFVMTKTQDQQLGYALDQEWYGLPEYTGWMREGLAKLTREKVNDAVHRHFSATDLQVVMITKDAAGLREELLAEGDTTMTYDSPKPDEVLAEDAVVGSRRLGVTARDVVVTPVESVFG
ncbi:MAG: pitrilysin family protein [Dehalococcoidia bacterium]